MINALHTPMQSSKRYYDTITCDGAQW